MRPWSGGGRQPFLQPVYDHHSRDVLFVYTIRNEMAFAVLRNVEGRMNVFKVPPLSCVLSLIQCREHSTHATERKHLAPGWRVPRALNRVAKRRSQSPVYLLIPTQSRARLFYSLFYIHYTIQCYQL